jgi:hydrogenase maturation protein HypF
MLTNELHNNCARSYLLTGYVQGVGFRPFVYHLAEQIGINGWIANLPGQVVIHAEGNSSALQQFEDGLITQAPPHAAPVIREVRTAQFSHFENFTIRQSEVSAVRDIHILTDLPICEHCLTELYDESDRRYHYPFINCTACGPRYSIIRQLPYDRRNTTMTEFTLCPACQAEYQDPDDRRYHAEPIACPECGPRLSFRTKQQSIEDTNAALEQCVSVLRSGQIVAVKGVGGYHLMCDARDDIAVQRLRQLKPRPAKPLAIMLDEQLIARYVKANDIHVGLLHSTIHPIVLIEKTAVSDLSAAIAPGLNEIGIMLPYSPLHHLLLGHFKAPLVATSANISGEPVLTENEDVEQRLHGVVDAYLHHDRPIQRPADDPVYRLIAQKPRPLRLGRGDAPLELNLPNAINQPTLAVGGHMKNTIALAWDNRVVISPHIGDLGSLRSQQVFEQVIADLQNLYHIDPQQIVCDAHPAYSSTRWARQSGLPVCEIMHHAAHAGCVAGEFAHESNWLVFTWDGVGMGTDNTLWGGEALLGSPGKWQRVASMRPYHLPGGDKAGREPWRSAAALCWETQQPWKADIENINLAMDAWQRRLNTPQSSAVGRLFDAAAALALDIHTTSFEGQGPMYLEAIAFEGHSDHIELPLQQDKQQVWRTDWSPLLPMLLDKKRSQADRARCFHNTMAHTLVAQAMLLREIHGDFAVGLSGGVFQNRLLTERCLQLLTEQGFPCYLPNNIPVNDAGLGFGQIIEWSHMQYEIK